METITVLCNNDCNDSVHSNAHVAFSDSLSVHSNSSEIACELDIAGDMNRDEVRVNGDKF